MSFSKTIYIKNINPFTTVQKIKAIMERFGKIKKIKKYTTKAYIEFETGK